jgi:16S rRNA (uracil1498-N3)-methyltransferase
MSHFYLNPENIEGNFFTIKDEQAHYLINVRRFKVNDEIMLFDGAGNSYKALITAISKTEIKGNILSSSYQAPNFEVNLYCAIAKGERFEWLIEKAAELGIHSIVPINTTRSVRTNFSENKARRFKNLSISASSQCGRGDIMEIFPPVDFFETAKKVSQKKDFINILPWEGENSFSIKDLSLNKNLRNVNIFIGPEGGFENREIDFAKSLNFQTITLGKNILRVETAAITASILVLFSESDAAQSRNNKDKSGD